MAKKLIPVCTEPGCLVRENHVDSAFIADLVVRLLSGEDLSDVMMMGSVFHLPGRNPFYRIKRGDHCPGCVTGVMRGRPPLQLVDSVPRVMTQGEWSCGGRDGSGQRAGARR